MTVAATAWESSGGSARETSSTRETSSAGHSACAGHSSFASRAGLKLDHALSVFRLDVAGLVCADLGSNVGGFVDCLLQRGAAKVYAVEKGRQMAEWAEESFRRSARAGVRIACGTDAGTPFNPHGSAPQEIVRMVEWGLPPLSALQAATSNAAALLRLSEVGTVDQGKAADLVLFDGDPLDDIGLVLKPALVMRAGRRVG